MTEQTVLQNCRVENNIVRLPEGQLDRKVYLQVSKALNLIGGKWKGHKIQGFVFQNGTNPTELLKSIAGGEKRNLKKEYQFFETSPEYATRLVHLATLKPTDEVCEPSAGQGAIVRAINEVSGLTPVCYELMETNRLILENRQADSGLLCKIIGNDFMENELKFDKIIANPPFRNNQDIAHVMKMYNSLRKNGRVVSIMSEHWTFASEKVCQEFRQFIEYSNARVIEIPAGAFKESGTNVGGRIVVIDRK